MRAMAAYEVYFAACARMFVHQGLMRWSESLFFFLREDVSQNK